MFGLHVEPSPQLESVAGITLQLPLPLQVSQIAVPHSVPAATKPSVGHVAEDPVQVSAMSQSPVAARQVAPAFPAGCVQAPPVHTSVVHGLPSEAHVVLAPGSDVQVPKA